MTATAAPVPTSRVGLLADAREAMSAKRAAEVAVLESALGWANAHVTTEDDQAASWSDPERRAAAWGERAVPIAGAGTPLIAEFAPTELAAALALSHEAALSLPGDVLDLAHRLPRTWRLVRDQRIPVHLGRLAAHESRELDLSAADHADRLLAWQPGRLNPHRVGVLVHEARLYADPDRAVADHDAALASRTVTVTHPGGRPGMTPGTSEVFMRLDTADAAALDTALSTMATTLGRLGHAGTYDVRRARAAGILADPQQALELLAGLDAEGRPRDDEAGATAEDAAFTPASPLRGLSSRSGSAEIVVHVHDTDLLVTGPLGHGGVARTSLGPVLTDVLTGWLVGHHRAKTFAAFIYRRLPDGCYEWTLPSGLTVTTDPPRRRPGLPR